jgi:hypothetical protein
MLLRIQDIRKEVLKKIIYNLTNCILFSFGNFQYYYAFLRQKTNILLSTQPLLTGIANLAGRAGSPFLVDLPVPIVARYCIVTNHQGAIGQGGRGVLDRIIKKIKIQKHIHLVMNHGTAHLISLCPHHLCVVTRTSIEPETLH